MPADGADVRSPPRQILLRFHGRATSGVRLLDAAGQPLALGPPARPAADAIAVPVEERLGHGSYTVTWPGGSSTFTVGPPAHGPAGVALVVCAALAALALPLGVAARSTRKRVPIALGALLLLAAPFVPRLIPAKTVARPDYFTTATSLGPYGLELGVSPDAPGTNTIDLLVTDRSGRRADLAGLDVTAAHARSAPLRLRPDRLAPGHFTIDFARLPSPGLWRLRVAARRFARTIPVPIPPTS